MDAKKVKKYLEMTAAEDYGTSEGAKKAAETRRVGHGIAGTHTQYGTTVMLTKNGHPTREMPHWNNHDKSVREMEFRKRHGSFPMPG